MLAQDVVLRDSMHHCIKLLMVFIPVCTCLLALSTHNAYAATYMQDNSYVYQTLFCVRPSYIDSGVITNTGVVVSFSDDGRIFYSGDGINFTQSNTSNLGTIHAPIFGGVGSNGNTIIFGEYILNPGICRLIRSADGGATWNTVLTLNDPGDIRHWHCVQYDPYNGNWYATSGDDNSQVQWWASIDNGATWIKMLNASGSQVYRCLDIIFTPDGQVWWGSDSNPPTAGIYHASLSDMTHYTKVYTSPHAMWGMAGSPSGTLIAINSVETGNQDNNANILTSTDRGKTWNIEVTWPINVDVSPSGGFNTIYGPDSNGVYYVGVKNVIQDPNNTVYGLELIPKSNNPIIPPAPSKYTISNNSLFAYGQVYADVIAQKNNVIYFDYGDSVIYGKLQGSVTPSPSPSPSPGQSVNISLVPGWNLISVPLNVTNSNIQDFFPSNVLHGIVDVWAWNESTQSWMYYSPNPEPWFASKFPAFTRVESGRAYWVEMNKSASFTITGTIPSMAPASPISLAPSWNFVGPTGLSSSTPETLYPSNVVDVWAWNESTQSWMYYSPNPEPWFASKFPAFNSINTGHGYWVELPG